MKIILFIGQAPARPMSKHEVRGTYLHAWLHSIGATDDIIRSYCHFHALTDTFPGSNKSGHRPPTKEQIAAYRPGLEKIIASLRPDIIVPVGKLAIQEITAHRTTLLEDVVGHRLYINPFGILKQPIPCIPLSHPSGRSVWNQTHKKEIARALSRLKAEAGF